MVEKKDCKSPPNSDVKKCLPKPTTKPPEYATFSDSESTNKYRKCVKK